MNLKRLTSPLLSTVNHGFYTRLGGASSGIFEGLNCGTGSSDQAKSVQINRSRVAEDMGGDLSDLVTVYQTHSATALTIASTGNPETAADAMVCASPNITLAVLTADCQPVLFADPNAKVIGAAHAGWRGALNGVLEATIDAMEELGAQRENIVGVIGPCISQPAYEVGQDFIERFLEASPDNHCFFSNAKAPEKYLFNLPGYGLFRLRKAGIKAAEWTQYCTYSDPKRFFSYRRATHQKQADYGRLISTIRLS
jgi:YfiH family protein